MSKTQPLAGKNILITRPAHQAVRLTEKIESLGGEIFLCPVMEIVPLQNPEPAREMFRKLETFDIAIFISANAVKLGMEEILRQCQNQPNPIPETLQLATVGLASAKALEKFGYKPDILPESRFDSEGLLATPQLQQENIAGKKIVIVRGEGGRGLLDKTLRERGAEVVYAEIYRRKMPNTDPVPLVRALQNGEINATVVTSNQGLENLSKMVGEAGMEALRKLPLVVPSERAIILAKQYNFQHPPLLAMPPDDDAIVFCLKQISSLK